MCNKSENVVCHFYRNDTPRCRIVDMHLKILAKKHIETRFVKLDAERAPFLTGNNFKSNLNETAHINKVFMIHVSFCNYILYIVFGLYLLVLRTE